MCVWESISQNCRNDASLTKEKYWFERMHTCNDELGLCRVNQHNDSYFEMTFDLDWSNSKKSDESEQLIEIPKNYFCHFEQNLDPEQQWEVSIYRYLSPLKKEDIEVIVTMESDEKSVFSNEYL